MRVFWGTPERESRIRVWDKRRKGRGCMPIRFAREKVQSGLLRRVASSQEEAIRDFGFAPCSARSEHERCYSRHRFTKILSSTFFFTLGIISDVCLLYLEMHEAASPGMIIIRRRGRKATAWTNTFRLLRLNRPLISEQQLFRREVHAVAPRSLASLRSLFHMRSFP